MEEPKWETEMRLSSGPRWGQLDVSLQWIHKSWMVNPNPSYGGGRDTSGLRLKPSQRFKHGLTEGAGAGSISCKTTNPPRRKWVGVYGQHLSIFLPLCTATTHDWMMDLLQLSELWGYSGDDSKTSMRSSGSAARGRASACIALYLIT